MTPRSYNTKGEDPAAESAPLVKTRTSSSKVSGGGGMSEKKQPTQSLPPTPPKSRLRDRISVVRGLLDMLHEDEDSSLQATNVRLVRASCATFVAWSFTMGMVLTFAPPESYDRALGIEKDVASLAFILLLLSSISRFLPYMYRDRLIHLSQKADAKSIFSNGFVVAAMTIQGIAMCADGLMAFLPTPVVIDPISGARVFLFRWSEWYTVGFLFIFLAEEIDAVSPENKRWSLIHALVQGGAMLAGFSCPFIPNPIMYWTVVSLSATSLFSMLFARIYTKWRQARTMRTGILELGYSQLNKEDDYTRVRLSLRALVECACLWTVLTTLHFVAAFLPRHLPEGHLLKTTALPMICETFCEVLSKHLHILVVEAVSIAFSERTRNDRMLELLRRMMGVVWERSSDTIAISISGASRRLCIVSPTVFALTTGQPFVAELVPAGEPVALVFEIPLESPTQGSSPLGSSARRDGSDSGNNNNSEDPTKRRRRLFSRLYYIRLHKEEGTGALSEQVIPIPVSPTLIPDVETVAELVEEAIQSPREVNTLNKDFVVRSEEEGGEPEDVVHCEVSVSRIEPSTVVMVFRDISERIKRFEAQKALAISTTEREKDSQTNRFTRHEVKNGLLSAIGLCDALKENAKDTDVVDLTCAPLVSRKTSAGKENANASQYLVELDTTLHEILDTVMSEAMSRDVIHQVYIPREEQVDIRALLRSSRTEESRFPVTTIPEILPIFLLDPQLLRFIHRNALSNGSKYGRQGGVVSTEVKYDSKTKVLNFDIINEPGEHHNKLVQLGDKAAREVFLSGRRLHTSYGLSKEQDSREVSVSSGDGAWIMRKCAKMLGGDVSITFNPERTIFNLAIPVTTCTDVTDGEGSDDEEWSLPTGTWGIVIDDSRVQRKILDRLLDFINIEKDRRVVLGASAEEVMGFNDKVKKLVETNIDDKFLIIADENLDIVENSTHHRTLSGSLCVERLLKDLLPADEKRVLAVVRSANDSLEDLALYTTRTHGFLLKEPIQRDSVNEKVRQIWTKRFHSNVEMAAPRRSKSQRRQSVRPSSEASDKEGGVSNLSSVTTTTADLTQIVEVIDNLLLHKQDDWPAIRDKFLVLKGDMMTLINRGNPRVVAVLEALEETRSAENAPSDLDGRWKLIRALIMSLV